jgi:hypothetical protein
MEADRFDRLVKTLAADTRRGLLRVLLSVPLVAGLGTWIEEASGQSGNGLIVGGSGGRRRRRRKRHDPGDKKDRRQRKRQRQRRREDRDAPGGFTDAPGGSECVPLHQICCPLTVLTPFCNPCCDVNAECAVSDAGSKGGAPDYTCRDKCTTQCTSDAECQARFPRSGPNIVCGENTDGIWCPRGIPGTGRCCRRRFCPGGRGCLGDVACCGLGGLGGEEVCCAANQTCEPVLGCFAP